MPNLIETAQDFLFNELSVIPVKKDKTPAVSKWSGYQAALMQPEEAGKCFATAHGIAVICGKVSGNLEGIDFDAHERDIEQVFNDWSTEQGIADIISRNQVYIERSPRGGYHVFYRYETDKPEGSQKLANWENGESMIETKGEGGYVIVSPTPNYTIISNAITDLPTISLEERDYLISHARNFNQQRPDQEPTEQVGEIKGYDHTDPVSWFNWNRATYAKQLLKDKGWVLVSTDTRTGIESWRRPGKTEGISATWGMKFNCLYCFSSSVEYFKPECYYTPFQILVILRFNGNHLSAYNWILSKYFDTEVPYIRVGTDYYKKIRKTDRFGLWRTELKAWKKDEIKEDKGKQYIDKIPRFDDFTILPDNFAYHPVIENCYNLYKEFSHTPKPGQWDWTEVLLHHIFGEQFLLGIRYVQALYLYPKRILPILVLVSKERQTGKTTFLNWLNMIFGDNMVNISPDDLAGAFNHIYATSNIIGIEETLIEKSLTVEKLKALATGKFISVNQKFVQQFKIPFYGKIILASNNEDKFARIDQEEIRFFVRKIGNPTIINHAIEDNLKDEIPAFLHYLTTLPAIDWTRDRTGFTPEEINNETLMQVKNESHTGLYKDLFELITEWFNNCKAQKLTVIANDIKGKWFLHNSRIDLNYIRNVIKLEFKLTPDRNRKYIPFYEGDYDLEIAKGNKINIPTRTGTAFCFFRDQFPCEFLSDDTVKDSDNEDNTDIPF